MNCDSILHRAVWLKAHQIRYSECMNQLLESTAADPLWPLTRYQTFNRCIRYTDGQIWEASSHMFEFTSESIIYTTTFVDYTIVENNPAEEIFTFHISHGTKGFLADQLIRYISEKKTWQGNDFGAIINNQFKTLVLTEAMIAKLDRLAARFRQRAVEHIMKK